MQRRLSVAMALIGDPRIIFLDESSSGLDPTSRQNLVQNSSKIPTDLLQWQVLEAYKEGRVMILTTHSMEEADTLSSKIGIIANGRLQCLGTPTHLKNKFGNGYTLHINTREENGDRVDEYVQNLVPSSTLGLG